MLKNHILNIFKNWKEYSTNDISKELNKNLKEIEKDLSLLEKEKLINKLNNNKYIISLNWIFYLAINKENWKEIKYNYSFLNDYIPNKTKFLKEDNLIYLKNLIKNNNLKIIYSKENQRLYEKVLIDLSYSSSFLEWNTYTKLDTERLIKYNIESFWKKWTETKMILNHKNAIEEILYNNINLDCNKKSLLKIHTILSDWLLKKEEIWVIRNEEVKIWWSWYIPLKNKFDLEIELEKFFEKLNQINEPLEQSLFILVFLSYLQIFVDVNKRTARIFANIPLIKNNLPIISFLDEDKENYLDALLKIYNENNVKDFEYIFIKNYINNNVNLTKK